MAICSNCCKLLQASSIAMAGSPINQKSKACKSCPWTKSNPEYYFDPEVLERTIVGAHQDEKIHSCHSNHVDFCTGYLSFAEQNLEDGLETFFIGKLALQLGIICRSSIPNLSVFNSVEEMIKSHRARLDKFEG
jgi:hypothetical protein